MADPETFNLPTPATEPVTEKVTPSEPVERYSKEYFEQRIKTLQEKIRNASPKQKDLDEDNVFMSMVQSYESTKKSLDSAKNLLKNLEKIDNGIDPSIIDQAKDLVEKERSSVDQLNKTTTNIGCNIVKTSEITKRIMENTDLLHDLLECTILVQATPDKLSSWYNRDSETKKDLLDQFLNDFNLMECFVKDGGPSHGNYGPALDIYYRLRNEFNEDDVLFERYSSDQQMAIDLAVAIALEHATPIPIFKHEQDENVDPIQRYHYYMDAYLKDELDDSFIELPVWMLRLVIDSNATDSDLTWGREYLKAYRPDEITWSDEHWRYNRAVRTDVGYRHPDHDFNNYVDLLSAGGECGARAWFGRFICKAWGIPTWGVRQPGHAAMSRWTSTNGWMICLGAGWEVSYWDETRYNGENKSVGRREGVDFFEEASARDSVDIDTYFRKVVQLECLAESFGETVEEDYVSEKFWRSLALAQRRGLANANSTVDAEQNLQNTDVTEEDTDEETCETKDTKGFFIQPDGTIVIPATNFVEPSKATDKVMVMESYEGDGTQLHLESDGEVVYELPTTIVGGTYTMSIKVVNVHRNQKPLLVSVHNSSYDSDGFEIICLPQQQDQQQELDVQYTAGTWRQTQGITVELSRGGRFKLTREAPCWGLTVKEILLEAQNL